MRLKSIKLAGFKSFVDPTTVPFPSNLSAIVGPNGCGKSNVIDAVRWVMGESSAKNLRGESMTDVIFNGSSGRKPVGQASIELVFDNSEGKLVGEYAQFNEISVKRKVTRDAQSHYFLNGTKCRRRDITDLFLGTGLGPRSYAIIEQGMISKLIESKPEELRVFLEEAAGISKYKERRKETESRMRRTQENLDRLGDLREELGRQLQHLQKQAQSAEKYTELKKQERQLKAQLNAIKWKKLDDDVIQWEKAVAELELALEKVLHSRTSNESEIEKLRLEHQQKAESFNKIQTQYYEFAAQIARMEQRIQFQKERAQQLKSEISGVVESVREARQQVDYDREKLLDVDQELEIAVPHLEELALKLETSSERLEQSEIDMQDWQHHWEAFNRTTADTRKNSEIHQSKIQFFEESIRKLEQRLEKNRVDVSSLDSSHQTFQLDELHEALLVFEEKEVSKRDELDAAEQNKRETAVEIETLGKRLLEHQKHIQIIEGQLSSKYALQSETESAADNEAEDALKALGFVDPKTLADSVDVEPKWANAAEHVLARLLSAYVVDHASSDLLTSLYDSQSGISIIRAHCGDNEKDIFGKTLYDCVKNATELRQYLSGIYLAESLDEALVRLSDLPALASVITPEGIWLHKEFTLFPNQKSAASGYLKRKNEIIKLEEDKQIEENNVQHYELEISRLKEQFAVTESATEAYNKDLLDILRSKSDLSATLAAEKARSAHIHERLTHLEEEHNDLVHQIDEEKGELEERHLMWQEAVASLESLSDEHENLLIRRDDLRAKLDNLRAQNRQERDSHHQAQLQVQGLKNQRQSFHTNMERASIQLERLEERKLVLEESFAENEEPLEIVQFELEDALERRMIEEERLAIARQDLDQVEQSMSALEKQRSASENEVSLKRSELERKRMELQALEIRRGNVLESIQKDEFILEELLLALPGDAEISVWEEEIQKVESRVSRLGAINLAAIDEYKIQSERKTFLDAQDEDLNEALATLEEAIRKIDRETKARFKETYDKVNHGLQALFPKVFGGGSAYLDLTGDDLLETGVSIMARPPGKKNSTIHLLSGGEKALTAIALIFSIFQLNPAPFCMLDEVDAPLDDANVARYANMVREMSSQVQFIYITHNKIAMEMADQLMGVTMHEPGVSRLVTVDVEEAAALAAI